MYLYIELSKPKPLLATKSALIAPIVENTPNFIPVNTWGMAFINITFLKVWNFDAPTDLASSSLSASTFIKPVSV